MEDRQSHVESDLARFRDADDYSLLHLAERLHVAGQRDRLHRLLVGNQAWMATKAERLTGYGAYRADLELALGDYTDPLPAEKLIRLVELRTAEQVVNTLVGAYSNEELAALVWLGREDEALAFAEDRVEAEARFSGLLAIQETLLRKGQLRPRLLDRLRQAVREIPQDEQRVYALRGLAIALAQAGDPHAASLFDKAVALARAIRDRVPYIEWPMLRAFGTAAKYYDREFVVALAQAGRFEEAERLADSIAYSGDRVHALCRLAIALARTGNDRADGIFARAEHVARTVGDVMALLELAAVFEELGDHRSGRVFDQAVELARTAKDVDALVAVGVALAYAGDDRVRVLFDEAMEAAEAISEVGRRAAALRELGLALALTQTQDSRATAVLDDAAQAVGSISDAEDRISALRELASVRVRIAQFSKALALLCPLKIEDFLRILTDWAPFFEDLRPGLPRAVLQAATRIATWARAEWREVFEKLISATDE